MENDSRLKLLKENIAAYPDFPKEGICFQDIFGAMRKSESLMALMSLVEDYAKSLEGQVDAVVALDARGFLFGPIIANTLKIPFVPVSKWLYNIYLYNLGNSFRSKLVFTKF